MPRRTHLRTRVLALTGAFAAVLFAITFGLSWRARVNGERWSRLVGVETRTIAALEELVRAQNAFHARYAGAPDAVHRYAVVEQLLQNSRLPDVDATRLRGRLRAFRTIIADPAPRRADIDATSQAVVQEAQELIDARKAGVARSLPELERGSAAMMATGLAVAWIVMVLSFAAVQTTLRRVVRPLEELSSAADRIAAGDLTAVAPVTGDYEIATVGAAFNRMADELKARARTDELTALPNFRAFRERIDSEIDRAARYPAVFGVLILDLDRFKKYNDTYGHLAGNGALQRVAAALRETVRSVDFAARYGGEEFAVIVPETDHLALAAVAERIRARVEGLPAPAGEAAVTISIGAALYPQDGTTAESLFHAADGRLYEAKEAGRNCAIVPGAEAVVQPG